MTHDQSAAVAAHARLVLAHAARLGLIAPTGRLADDVAQLADLHPGLSGFADITPAPGEDLPEADARERVVGHQLGDAYQALSVEARKGRALCQTPAFITDLLLDLSFDYAYERWGPRIRMIDPACGTGHILVETLLRARTRQRLGLGRGSRDDSPCLPSRTTPLEFIAAALDTVHGVDLDPYAVLVARYRLLAVALSVLRGEWRYEPTPAEVASLPLNVACADSLLDEGEPLLSRGAYHVVVANPPYITVKDKALGEAVRDRYREVCSGQYSLALPFHQLMTELLVPGGWCAQLTANSFMKREFGKKYVEQYLSRLDLTWVIDTSGAFIPGHGTPTVIIVNRNQPPSSDTVSVVQGIRGEPSKPDDPARGVVWTEIARGVGEREAMARLARGLEELQTAAEPESPAAGPEVSAPVAYTQPSLFDLLEGDAA